MKGTQCPATDPASIQAHELHAHHDELHCAIDLMPRLFIWRGSCALHSGEDAFLRFQRDDPSQNVNGCVRDDSSRSAEDEREFDEMWREFVRSEPVQEVDDPFMHVWMVDVDGAVQKKLEQFSEDEFQEAKQLGIAPTVPVKEKEKGGSVCPSFLKVDKVAQETFKGYPSNKFECKLRSSSGQTVKLMFGMDTEAGEDRGSRERSSKERTRERANESGGKCLRRKRSRPQNAEGQADGESSRSGLEAGECRRTEPRERRTRAPKTKRPLRAAMSVRLSTGKRTSPSAYLAVDSIGKWSAPPSVAVGLDGGHWSMSLKSSKALEMEYQVSKDLIVRGSVKAKRQRKGRDDESGQGRARNTNTKGLQVAREGSAEDAGSAEPQNNDGIPREEGRNETSGKHAHGRVPSPETQLSGNINVSWKAPLQQASVSLDANNITLNHSFRVRPEEMFPVFRKLVLGRVVVVAPLLKNDPYVLLGYSAKLNYLNRDRVTYQAGISYVANSANEKTTVSAYDKGGLGKNVQSALQISRTTNGRVTAKAGMEWRGYWGLKFKALLAALERAQLVVAGSMGSLTVRVGVTCTFKAAKVGWKTAMEMCLNATPVREGKRAANGSRTGRESRRQGQTQGRGGGAPSSGEGTDSSSGEGQGRANTRAAFPTACDDG